MVNCRALTDPLPVCVADASAVISLLATGVAEQLLRAFPERLRVVGVVSAELDDGKGRWPSAKQLAALAASAHLELVELDDRALECFESLVIGPAIDTLDDGEAATIAYAVAIGTAALIDEKKGRRICGSRFPQLRLHTTVDLLTSVPVGQVLGEAAIADAIFNALTVGRMRVPANDYERVVAIIGQERARLCPSLPDHVRFPRKKLA